MKEFQLKMETKVVNGEKILKEIKNFLIVLFTAILSAIGMHVFVIPASFAPGGIDGIATMLAEATGLGVAYFILLFNVPLLMLAWFILKKRYVIYTVTFTVISSALMILFEVISFYQFEPVGEGLISAVFSGILFGVRTGLLLKLGGSSGGIDIIGCMVQKKLPHKNPETIITLICYGIIFSSFFVYGEVISILLSIVQMFVFERIASHVQRENRNAIEVKIITKDPETIRNDIIFNLKHGATVLESKGMFTGEKSAMVISIINIRQLPELLEILKKYPNTFTYYDEVGGVRGNFRWNKDDIAK